MGVQLRYRSNLVEDPEIGGNLYGPGAFSRERISFGLSDQRTFRLAVLAQRALPRRLRVGASRIGFSRMTMAAGGSFGRGCAFDGRAVGTNAGSAAKKNEEKNRNR